MNLAEIKRSNIPKRRLYQIERLIVREATDLWCKEQSFYSDNFAADVEVDTYKKRITIAFGNTACSRMLRAATPPCTSPTI